MTLYEISESVLAAVNNLQIDEQTGEILDVSELDSLQAEFEEKAENIACYIKNLTAEADAMKAEEKALSERRKSAQNKADRLKRYLSDNMQKLGRDKISTPRAALSFRKSTSVIVDDEFIDWAVDNADELLTFKEPTVNKTAVKNAIADGRELEHAHLETAQNLQIR